MSKHNHSSWGFLMLLLVSGLLISIYNPSRTAETRLFQDPEQVEVIAASRIATSTEPLLGMPPPTVSLGAVRSKKPIRLNPNVLVSLGPARRDPVLQSSVRRRRPASRAPRARAQTPIPGKNLEGIGEGFRG